MPDLQEHTEVRTTRLRLRGLCVEDAEDVHLIRSRPEAMLYSHNGPEASIEHTQGWIRGCLSRPNVYNFAIELLSPEDYVDKTDDKASRHKVIGLVGAVGAPEIGYMFHPDFWGRGLATEALQAFMPLYWQQFRSEFDFASAKIDPANGQSKRVLQKCGFSLEDRKIKSFGNPSLGLRDIEIYRLQRPAAVCQ
ncbi:GNAT domain-containing protein [Phyllosticta capitalensis]|uniref:GNAT domain-containing protein n=1 Tax=Phyllosticta capitalensis TaxID=121624 RepID=A0ABR1YFD9_9PEZI